MEIKNENCVIHIPDGWKTSLILRLVSFLYCNKPKVIIGEHGEKKNIYIVNEVSDR